VSDIEDRAKADALKLALTNVLACLIANHAAMIAIANNTPRAKRYQCASCHR
jgi:hypothetical protein